MLYPFSLDFELGKVAPRATNEQWNTQAEAFEKGANAIDPVTPADYEHKARLYEWAAAAFDIAAARTLGHKKAERYGLNAHYARIKAAELYVIALNTWEHVRANAEVERLIANTYVDKNQKAEG